MNNHPTNYVGQSVTTIRFQVTITLVLPEPNLHKPQLQSGKKNYWQNCYDAFYLILCVLQAISGIGLVVKVDDLCNKFMVLIENIFNLFQ